MYSKNQLIQQYKEHVKKNTNTFDKKNGIRILSYNVQLFKDINQYLSFNKLEKIIADSDADVIVLFEALFIKNYKEIFEEKIINNKYPYVKYCNDKYGINVLLSKYPVEKCSVLRLQADPIKKMNRYAIISTISINNSNVKIAACHLDVFDESEQTRLKQIKQILSEIDNEYILLGDLNSLRKNDYDENEWKCLINDCNLRNTNAHTLVTDFIESNQFIDSWSLTNKSSLKVSVWSMRRVDYVYIGKQFKYKINNCNIYFSDASDHFPLYIDLKI